MAKTILIPIDFKVESLNTLRFALAEQTEPVRVVLLYGHLLSSSISDLLFYSPTEILQGLKNPKFNDALKIFRNRFEAQILDLRFELLNHNGQALLNNLLDALSIDKIYLPKTYLLNPGEHGFDTTPLLKKTKLSTREINWRSDGVHDNNTLDVLFVNIQSA